MWRAFFLALGISSIILGLEVLALERATLHSWVLDATREVKFESWMPWSLLSTGVVVLLYSFTLPKRAKD